MANVSYLNLTWLAEHLRDELKAKKTILLYAYNGTGKTRLSTTFKDLGKAVDENGEVTKRDTLYFNAYTEDLFTWDNDLENDQERVLELPLSQNSCRLDRIQNPGAMRRERSGSIRTKIQGQSARSTVAAGGRLSGSGFPGTEHFG
ncbi:hypothetical protein I8J34_23755, partial [Denitromonas sp. IR12]|nr:hypothetical protein [Denitromonas iodatirespirans]